MRGGGWGGVTYLADHPATVPSRFAFWSPESPYIIESNAQANQFSFQIINLPTFWLTTVRG